MNDGYRSAIVTDGDRSMPAEFRERLEAVKWLRSACDGLSIDVEIDALVSLLVDRLASVGAVDRFPLLAQVAVADFRALTNVDPHQPAH